MGWGLMLGLKAWIPTRLLPAEANVQLNGQVLIFAAVIVIMTGIFFGLAPALHSAGRIWRIAQGGWPGRKSRGRAIQVRNVLVVAEIAIAFILLSGSALLIRSFYRLQRVDPGFDSTNVITMRLPMTSEQYPNRARIISYLERVLDQVRAVPGVRDIATTAALPLQGWSDGMPFLIKGRPFVDVANRPSCGFKPVSPSYLAALGMRLVKGRWLAESDAPGTPPVTVINETMAKRYFKNEDPVGKLILIQQIIPGQPALGPEIPWQVVGVSSR